MMMSKKPRPPIKRTTSLKQFTVDLPTSETESDPPTNPFKTRQKPASYGDVGRQKFQSGGFDHGGLPSMVSPRNGRRFSDEFETANFLRSCNLCKRRLVPTRDLYMYRGNTAFCSDECRQQQMNQDEIKEKRSLLSTNKESSPSSSSSSSSISKSTKNEIVGSCDFGVHDATASPTVRKILLSPILLWKSEAWSFSITVVPGFARRSCGKSYSSNQEAYLDRGKNYTKEGSHARKKIKFVNLPDKNCCFEVE